VYVSGFGHVLASAMGGAYAITLSDSTGSATLGATPTYAQMSGNGFFYEVFGFTAVTVHATGQDAAYLYDLPGSSSNRLDGDSSAATLSGPGYSISTTGFAAVTVYASQGNTDAAHVYWDTITYRLSLEGNWTRYGALV
jgi:hypothetical protein